MRFFAYMRRGSEYPVLLSGFARGVGYLAGVAVLAALAFNAYASVAAALAHYAAEQVGQDAKPTKVAQSDASPQISSRVLADEWFRAFPSGRSYSSSGGNGSWSRSSRFDQRNNLTRPPETPGFGLFDWDDDRRWRDDWLDQQRLSGTYRTMCVRMCDGYYFPISFATTRDRFARDEATCQSSCGSEAKLFVYRNPGQDPEQMVDLRGQPYGKLKTAFLYRSSYNESCKCRPEAWEQVSMDRHKGYALEARARKGDKVAAKELQVLRQSQRQTVLEQKAEAKKSTVEKRTGRVAAVSRQNALTDLKTAADATPAAAPALAPEPRAELRPDAVDPKRSGPGSPAGPADKKAKRQAKTEPPPAPNRSSSGEFTHRRVFER